MSTALYLYLVITLIPLAVVVIAVAGEPLLVLPHRLFPRISANTAYAWGVTVLALVGTALELALAFPIALGR